MQPRRTDLASGVAQRIFAAPSGLPPRRIWPRQEARVSRITLAALVGLALAAIAGMGLAILELPQTLLMIGAIGLIAIVPLAVKAYRGTFDPFEPLTVSSAAVLLFFVVRPLFDMANGEFAWAGADVSQRIPQALWATLLAVAAFTAGYLVIRPMTWAYPIPPAEVGEGGLLFWGTVLTGLAIAGLAAAAMLSSVRPRHAALQPCRH